MDWTSIFVTIDEDTLPDGWRDLGEAVEFPMSVQYMGCDEALAMMETGSVALMFVFADGGSPYLNRLFDTFKKKVGAIPHFQTVICSDPDPHFMADVFEFGIEQFISVENWAAEAAALMREAVEILSDSDSVEVKTLNFSSSLLKGDQQGIRDAESELGDAHEYDFLAAYTKGKACEATGRFDEAVDAFKASREMNKFFRPTNTGLAENLMVTGRMDEAIEILEHMEKSNPRNVERKANLAIAHIENGDVEKAQKYISAAKELDPDSSKIVEADAQALLAQGKIGEVFKMMDNMSEVGPYFAAKLNEMGIKLSQAGKGKSALALYQKAHKVVRTELKYKISMNAALACHRMQEYRMALKYLNRCERELGESSEKIEKIKRAVKSAAAKAKEAS